MANMNEKKLLKLGEDFKKLKEENKFLDEKVSYLCQTHKKSIEKLSEMHEKEVIELKNHARIGIKLQKKNKELKEENKELQEKYDKLHVDKIAKELLDEAQIEELKEENEAQYIITNDIEQHEDYEEYFGIIKKLEEEIKELNKKKSIKWSREYAMPLITQLKEEIKLKDEIISLHETEERGLIQVVDFYKSR